MSVERGWERLIEYVDSWASAREVPGGIEITLRPWGVEKTVEVVITPEDWDNYISTIFGVDDPHVTPLRSRVLAAVDVAPYLIYNTYDWVPSHARELPAEVFADMRGEWFVTDAEGNVIDRLVRGDEQ